MDNARRRELQRGYKEEKKPQGIFALRCADRVWVGASRNLRAEQNRSLFALRQGGHRNKAMQAAWNAHGEAAFSFEVLEEVDDENPLLIPALLKERESHWRAALNATSAMDG